MSALKEKIYIPLIYTHLHQYLQGHPPCASSIYNIVCTSMYSHVLVLSCITLSLCSYKYSDLPATNQEPLLHPASIVL